MARTLRLFDDGGRHPLVLFHEASVPSAVLGAIRKALSSHRRLLLPARVDFPPGPPTAMGPGARPPGGLMTTHNRTGWGYYHMLQFFAFDVFHHSALSDAEYVMRIDSDATIDARMPDLFAMVRLRGAAYLTPVGNADCGDIVEGLPGLAYAAAEIYGLEARVKRLVYRKTCRPGTLCMDRGKLCVLGFYNNLEVVRVADFIAPPPAAAIFASAVQRSLGIYRHRWGDAIIRRLMLALMGSSVIYLDELAPLSGYCHRQFCVGARGNTRTDKFGQVHTFELAVG